MKKIILALALMLASFVCLAKDDIIETNKGTVKAFIVSIDGSTVLYLDSNYDEIRLPLNIITEIKIEGVYQLDVHEGLTLAPNEIQEIRRSIKAEAAAKRKAAISEKLGIASESTAKAKDFFGSTFEKVSSATKQLSTKEKSSSTKEKSSFFTADPHCTSHDGFFDIAFNVGFEEAGVSYGLTGSYGITDRAIVSATLSWIKDGDSYFAIAPMYMLDGIPSYNGGVAIYAGVDIGSWTYSYEAYDEKKYEYVTKHKSTFVFAPSALMKWQMTDRLFIGGFISWNLVDNDEYFPLRGGFSIGWQFR